jgi:1-deoxy-D-xylulose-5-phosphate synthase
VILDRINNPKDLREIHPEQLPQLCEELRSFIQESANAKPGHIRSSLGVTELSVALHYVMETPRDILIWDVGHQAYVHKVLTGRKDFFHTNRQKGGISGFYDPGRRSF